MLDLTEMRKGQAVPWERGWGYLLIFQPIVNYYTVIFKFTDRGKMVSDGYNLIKPFAKTETCFLNEM
jgi:hypothetical protein